MTTANKFNSILLLCRKNAIIIPICDVQAFCLIKMQTSNAADIYTDVYGKGKTIMRIAVTYENGNVFQHFGHTEQFKLYDIEDNTVKICQVVSTLGQGHGALADFLKSAGVDVLICGGIGGRAQTALAEAGILLCGGVSGNSDDAVNAYLSGSLIFSSNVTCGHHHDDGHSCGENKHGCAGSRNQCGK